MSFTEEVAIIQDCDFGTHRKRFTGGKAATIGKGINHSGMTIELLQALLL